MTRNAKSGPRHRTHFYNGAMGMLSGPAFATHLGQVGVAKPPSAA